MRQGGARKQALAVGQRRNIAKAEQFGISSRQRQIKDFGGGGQEPIYGIAMLKPKVFRYHCYFVRQGCFTKRRRERRDLVCGRLMGGNASLSAQYQRLPRTHR